MNIIKFDEDLKIAFNFNNVKTVYEIIQGIANLPGSMAADSNI